MLRKQVDINESTMDFLRVELAALEQAVSLATKLYDVINLLQSVQDISIAVQALCERPPFQHPKDQRQSRSPRKNLYLHCASACGKADCQNHKTGRIMDRADLDAAKRESGSRRSNLVRVGGVRLAILARVRDTRLTRH